MLTAKYGAFRFCWSKLRIVQLSICILTTPLLIISCVGLALAGSEDEATSRGQSCYDWFFSIQPRLHHFFFQINKVVQYSCKNKQLWMVLECGSALLPFTFEERRGLIHSYGPFSFIYADTLRFYTHLIVIYVLDMIL
jgi:hypothetical protein